MRILAIRGKNLASLEGEFEIDFTTEPLKSAGIFAITGSTGSGKSTLLDALCLALFDDTPRTNRASENNIQITDVKDKTINQKDSRNILRRGTSDGYAEVDFVSLGGEKFRSRWSVRRSRDRVGGTLQNSELRLANLTTNVEEQGRKTELLAKIVGLIGLTFDQFTRAVLLAQGDFATFLKATQKEKAELLEKLTGTEVYSRISAVIYEKSKNAEQELNLIRERIRDIELLSEEEVKTLGIEKLSIIREIESQKIEMEVLANKIKWITDEAALDAGVKEAEQRLAGAVKAIEEAKPRYDYLAQVDSVQEIRDSFNELKTSDKQLTENKRNLAEQEKLRDTNALRLKQSTEKVALCESRLLKFDEEFKNVEPEIKQARELDIQIAGARNNAKEAEEEYNQAGEKKNKLGKSIVKTQTSIDSAKETASQARLWFSQNEQYKDIIPRVELIVNLLDDATAAIKQKANNAKTLADSNTLLASATVKRAELLAESERLNKLLPAEITALRLKLEDGKPCPVCGSERHPYRNISGESLVETELNRAKKEVADKIALLDNRIESLKSENIRLASVIENYASQSKEAMNKSDGFLALLPDWKTKFEQGALQNLLKSVAGAWSKNESTLRKANEQIATFQASLELEKEQLIEAGEAFATKYEKHKNTKNALENLQEKRAGILEGEAADEVEKQYTQRKKELSGVFSKLKEEQNKILAANEKQEGVIKQISREISRLSGHCDDLQIAVDTWILSRNKDVTVERLSDLLSRDNAWVIAERELLNRLHQGKTTALATLNERKKTLENHHLTESKPAKEETKDILQETLADRQEATRRKTARNTEIDILLANHNRGKERIALFEKELNEKSALSENWKKLNEMFGSADGSKFKVLAQGYTLDALLAYANKHLQELSKRYEIQRIPDTLALQVVDLDMLGEVRTVHSLSGGESFLISLALALGLSSLSSNRMKVESLFIDEGFGSLDIETLRIAMDALERLQTQGRKIGIISHVAEMTERINAQIQVIKAVNGRSRIEIIRLLEFKS
ncbi:MAG: AAA family ATPase [Tannerellaceae bacterium]|jgi:exonuclease SbcC|nr:AAA family ATPase [Tannerellaceae bacterium]